MIHSLRKSMKVFKIHNFTNLKKLHPKFIKNFSTAINYNLEENYNYYNIEFYQDIKNIPAVCNGTICPTCKGLGWVNENKYNINSKKDNKYDFKNNFNFELCKNCNGTGFY